MNNFLKLILSIVICFIPAALGFLYLEKPFYFIELPLWLVAPVWIIIHLLAGVSLFSVWKEGLKNLIVRNAFVIFIIQLIFNVAWIIVLFGVQSILAGMILAIILWVLVIMTVLKFRKVSGSAAILLTPYFLWVTFASFFNISVFIFNK